MKSVKVHDDTHRALKRLKAKRRSRSIDQVIREMVRDYTGASVREEQADSSDRLTEYLDK
ncbi:MAG: ribbon-helix-helix protein, CopG family [Thaumarchaeota archaeon]|nr:ribbon-helix-helix protein, CopG family [Nitrososphaerota archaeon]